MNAANPLAHSWPSELTAEFSRPYMRDLSDFLRSEISAGKILYPHGKEILAAFQLTPFAAVKVVIIGQDPYHGPGQAHGLAFSVPPRVPLPPSLRNIFLEVKADLGLREDFPHGHLVSWAQQGVLLLNAVLTVEAQRPASHQNRGWEQFTDQVVRVLSEQKEHLVFVLWGRFAAQKAEGLIDHHKHLVLKAHHPSPLSAHRGFFGCRHFSQINRYLEQTGQTPITWRFVQ